MSEKELRKVPCSGLTELFYSDKVADHRWAVKICKTCPFQEPCLEAAITRREVYGVWGGRVFTVRRRRGRPPKDAPKSRQKQAS